MRISRTVLSLFVLNIAACATESPVTETDDLDTDVSALAACTPAPPINPNLCDPREPAPAPPAVNGFCDVELRVDAVGFFEGQGWFEGRAEAAASFTATNLRSGAVTTGRYPSSGTVKMEVDKEHITSVGLGTYRVKENRHLDVKVCGVFTEEDKLSADDIGTDCEVITLSCPQASMDVGLSADLCKGGNCTKLKGRMTANVHVLTADADHDCVPNEDDYTPEPCDEAFKGQLCRASLVYFHYGDGILNDLAQNLGTDLQPAMTGYDRVVLLIDDDQVGPFNVNPAALALADVVMLPTEENFFASLQDLTSRGCDLDTWMFSHGSPIWRAQLDLSVLPEGGSITAQDDDEHFINPAVSPDITTDELAEDTDPANSGTPAVPIRMTYGTPCFYEAWNQTWLAAGAKVTSGAIDINFMPNRFGAFATSWSGGVTYGASLAGEPSTGSEALAFGFIAAEGLAPPYLCIGNTVLGTNACAEDFFTDRDFLPLVDANGQWASNGPDTAKYAIGGPRDDLAGIAYDPNLSGAVNMRSSSVKVLTGNGGISKTVPATLTWP